MRRNVRKALSILMVAVLCFGLAACGSNSGGTPQPNGGGAAQPNGGGSSSQVSAGTVTQPLDLNALFAAPANAVQDFHYWTGKEILYESNPHRDKNPQVFYYMLDVQAMSDYATMLQKNGFTLVDFFNQSANAQEWALTSDRCPDAALITSVYSKTQCHVAIRKTDDTRKFRIDVSPDLLVCDVGLRRDGSVADVRPQGASAGAGLIRLADGSYQTSDGRLTAAVGTAMVLRDGVAYNTTATFALESGNETILTGNYYRDQFIYLLHRENALMTGDIFREQDLAGSVSRSEMQLKSVTTRTYGDKPAVLIAHGTTALLPSYTQNNYEQLTMQVMYYQPGSDAVYYVYGRFADKTEPKEVEALIAVNMAGGGSGAAIENTTYVKPGSTIKLVYTHREFGTSYDVFKWEVVEGAGKVTLNATGDTCEVTAQTPGLAIVRVTYEYGVEEPDVLTGVLRTVNKAITQDYSFVVE